ncbi:MAG TPA: hypothetical protein VNI02_22685 [Blastocatellia bacterium]|nr:hypothetical protein [Blastocatellia bacterium]
MQSRKVITLLSLVLLMATVSIASPATFNKQSTAKPAAADTVSGKYEGVAKSDQMGEIPLTVELKNDNGKLSGKIETPQGPAPITSGTYADGKLTMKFDAGGNEGTVTATVNGDKITGKWELGGVGGPVELKRSGAASAGDAKKEEKKEEMKPAAADPVSGEWDASAEAQGTTIPFTLKLKLDGDKVSGSSESSQGSAPISKGTFVANKLTFSLDTPGGTIQLTGMVKDGKITGEFDFAGQMTGKWEAKKK